jgi:thiamine biosynthesis protein ThiS
MQVTVNGARQELPEGATVRGLLEHLALATGPVAVEINRVIIPRAQHALHVVNDGDTIEIVQFVGGG